MSSDSLPDTAASSSAAASTILPDPHLALSGLVGLALRDTSLSSVTEAVGAAEGRSYAAWVYGEHSGLHG